MEHIIIKDYPPLSVPPNVGVHYVDRVNKRLWFSIGTSSLTDWIEQGVGDGVTVVPAVTYLVHGSPEGVQVALVGQFAWDLDNQFLYFKEQGNGLATGWVVH